MKRKTEPTTPPHQLAYRPRDAARMLGISERTLFGLAKRGLIRSRKLGRAVLFSDSELRRFLAADGDSK